MRLTIVYDGDCGFCRWSRDWLAGQRLLVPVTFRPSSDPEARCCWGHIDGYGDELFVVADDGSIWTGTDAFVMALWATAAHRRRVAGLTGPIARALLRQLSARRGHLSGMLDGPCHDGSCAPV